MSRAWTEDQKLAISKSGSNIIVSAGAGSGKTAVLTKRVTEKLRNGINIRSLLILTFTNAAASEMKERIRKALSNEENLKEELEQLDSAYITTFDSYALSLVKKYHYILNLPKEIKITSSSVVSIKKEEILDNLLNEYYEEKDENFIKLINSFCIKDDKNIRSAIIKYDNKLNLRTDKIEYLKSYIENYYSVSNLNNLKEEYLTLIKEKIDSIKELLKDLELSCDNKYYEKVITYLSPLINNDEYHEWLKIKGERFPTLPRNSEEELKNIKSKISDIIKEISGLLIYQNTDEMVSEISKTKDFIKVIIDILLELDKRVKTWKRINNAYEFNDISELSLNLLKNNKEIREEIKNSFSEILVDEYQDTNDIQEEFISYIANHNVYMVGDIKQSIYQFRNANPYIFKSKYDKYKNLDDGIKIDLMKNFRSRKEVLDNINVLFDPIMDDEVGGADYKHEHQMVAGNMAYVEKGKTNENYNMDILNYTYDKECDFTKREIEVFTIAKDIKDKIANHYPIFEMGKGITRDATYKDFTILLQTSADYELYKKIFLYFNIPLQVYQDESIKTSDDVHLIKNIFILLNSINNNNLDVNFKHANMSVGRSFLFSYSDDYLYNVITNKTYKETTLYQTCLEIKPYLNTYSFAKLLDLIIEKFDIYNLIIKVGDINHTLARLDYLNNVSVEASNLGFNMDEFINYLDQVLNGSEDIKMKGVLDNSNTVKLMNIHKSKGLEFPICYFASLDAKFNTDDTKGDFLYDKKYGLIIPYFEDGLRNTIVKTLYKNNYIKEMISEKIRLFYVALTRAKEKMIFVTDLSKKEDVSNEIVPTIERLSFNSLRDMMAVIKDRLNSYITEIDIDKLNLSKQYMLEIKANLEEKLEIVNTKINEHNLEITNNTLKEVHYSKETHTLFDDDINDLLKLGNEVHLILEIIDFNNPNLDFIESDYIKEKINTFLNLDILKNIKDGQVFKEYQFIIEDNKTSSNGVIDLFIVYNDHIDLIDYKLKNIDDPNYIKQVNGYKEYLTNIFNKPVNGYLYSIMDTTLKEV